MEETKPFIENRQEKNNADKGLLCLVSIVIMALFAIVGYAFISTYIFVPVMRVNVCGSSILYGNLNASRVRDFVQYHRTLGFEKVIGYIHPEFQDNLQQFSMAGLDLAVWETRYDYKNSSQHRAHHYEAMARCIQTSKDDGFRWTAVIDYDEFFYYNPKTYASAFDFFHSFKNKSQITLQRRYYEIDLCFEKDRDASIFDLPYSTPSLAAAPKSIVDPSAFSSLSEKMKAHHFEVLGDTGFTNEKRAHFKHFRRFLTWGGDCKRSEFKKRVFYKEDIDLSDPAQKKEFYMKQYEFWLDEDMGLWKTHLSYNEKEGEL